MRFFATCVFLLLKKLFIDKFLHETHCAIKYLPHEVVELKSLIFLICNFDRFSSFKLISFFFLLSNGSFTPLSKYLSCVLLLLFLLGTNIV